MSDNENGRTLHEKEFWQTGFSRVVFGAAVAMLAAQVTMRHGGFGSVDGVLVLFSGAIVWAWGFTYTFQPVIQEFNRLSDLVRSGSS